MKTKFFLIISIFCSVSLFSQTRSSGKTIFQEVPENVYLHLNSTSLFTGETLYYSFYCWDQAADNLSEISKIGYVELLGKDGKSILKQKIELSGGKGNGDFYIPSQINTGWYKLVAYTRWMLNKPVSEMYQTDILIINPFQVLPENMIIQPTDSSQILNHKVTTSETSSETTSKLVNKEVYGSREKVDLNFTKLSLQEGHYSLSVRKKGALDREVSRNSKSILKTAKSSHKGPGTTKNFLPELRGEMLVGTIENKNEPSDIAHKTVALSIPGEDFMLKLVKTDNQGVFRFVLDPMPNTPNVVLQVMEEDRENYLVQLEPGTTDFSSLQFEDKAILSADLKEEIQERRIAIQIENAYHQSKQDLILEEPASTAFFAPLGKEYILEDYTRFPSLEKTIIEILSEMTFKKKKGKYQLHIRNGTEKSILPEKPLIMVDGLFLQEYEELFGYDTRKLYKISILPKKYIYGAHIFGGIANFVTSNNDFKFSREADYFLKTTILRPLSEKKYFTPDYAEDKAERIPDYRYQLLWQPNFSPQTPSSFYTSDVTGVYEISIEGFTKNGKPVSINQTFEVK